MSKKVSKKPARSSQKQEKTTNKKEDSQLLVNLTTVLQGYKQVGKDKKVRKTLKKLSKLYKPEPVPAV